MSSNTSSQQIGGTHYAEGVKTSPWDLQKSMESTGNVFVDGRRCDAIRYAARLKGKDEGTLPKLAEDLRKSADCSLAAARHIEEVLLRKPLELLTFYFRNGVTFIRRGQEDGKVSYRPKRPALQQEARSLSPHEMNTVCLNTLIFQNEKQLRITKDEIILMYRRHAKAPTDESTY